MDGTNEEGEKSLPVGRKHYNILIGHGLANQRPADYVIHIWTNQLNVYTSVCSSMLCKHRLRHLELVAIPPAT